MSNDESDAAKCAASIRALGELFSDPKSRAQVYHRYLLVERSSGQLVFEQEDFDFVFEQAVAKAFGRPKPRRRMIRIALRQGELTSGAVCQRRRVRHCRHYPAAWQLHSFWQTAIIRRPGSHHALSRTASTTRK